MDTLWYQNKADSLVHAWRMNYGDDPSEAAVVLALSVAIHETRAGDAWPGEKNWGATTLRALNAAEKAAVKAAGITPSVGKGHEAKAKAAQAAIVAAGLPLPQGNIHCDSAPTIGPYFVWFASFPNDVEGAAYFLKLLCGLKSRKTAYSVLVNGGNEVGLATAMYLAGYYTGFYKKTSYYVFEAGKWRELRGDEMLTGIATKKGSDLNIAAYAGALQRITPAIRLALKDWHFPSGEPTEDPAPETDPTPTPRRTLRKGMNGTDVATLQTQLGKIAVSGNFDSQTEARVREFQQVHGLLADGEVGPLTWAVLDGLHAADTDPAPPLIPLDVDWDELRRERDALIREMED